MSAKLHLCSGRDPRVPATHQEFPMQASQFRSRRIPHFLFCTLLIASALLMPSLLCAQAYFGSVSGELTDASGAVMPGASVTRLAGDKGFHVATPPDSRGS